MIAIGAVVVAVLAGIISYKVVSGRDGGSVTIPDSDPAMQNINWVKKKAKEAAGDMERLSPEDKAKVISILGKQYAPRSFKMYANAP